MFNVISHRGTPIEATSLLLGWLSSKSQTTAGAGQDVEESGRTHTPGAGTVGRLLRESPAVPQTATTWEQRRG